MPEVALDLADSASSDLLRLAGSSLTPGSTTHSSQPFFDKTWHSSEIEAITVRRARWASHLCL